VHDVAVQAAPLVRIEAHLAGYERLAARNGLQNFGACTN
jgi:hypothetical protein